MNRKFNLIEQPINLSAEKFLGLAQNEYSTNFPTEKNPFSYCIIHLKIEMGNQSFRFSFPKELKLNIIHKRPGGAKIGGNISNIDIREVTNIRIPKYENKYYFDFVFFIYDWTTASYWCSHLWTKEICLDLRYYLTSERKIQYFNIGKKLAEQFTKTNILGHVNLRTSKLKSSNGISRLIRHGWLPSISLLPQPYGEMIRQIELENDISKINKLICDGFQINNILENMLERWRLASLTNNRIDILETSINSYLSNDYISTIYTLIPQIEGLITYHIKRRKEEPENHLGDKIIQFGEIIKNEIYNTNLTRYLTNILVKYLKTTFFKTWSPNLHRNKKYSGGVIAPQRNLLLHGAIKKKYFTAENCLKLFCILDNIILLSLTKKELKK